MFSSPILDLVILLSFIYFVGSLILSSLNEAISGTIRKRPRQLQQSLENLFFGGGWTQWVQGTLMQSPHIQSLMKAPDKYPSYIPASNFVLAVIGQIGAASFSQANLQKAILVSSLPGEFKTVLADLAAKGNNDITQFQKSLEEFYNNAMDRAGGIYKKETRFLLFFLGLGVAVFLNLDTIQIVKDELANKANLSKVADMVGQQVPKIKGNKDTVQVFTIQAKNGTINAGGKVDTSKHLNQDIKQARDLTVYMVQTTGYNIGYASYEEFTKVWTGKGNFLIKLFGVIITAFALQLSSGFWFDLMNKAVNIRAAGQKPTK